LVVFSLCSQCVIPSIRRLVDYAWVLVRLRCDVCERAESYRLARLAVKYGPQILLDDLIVRLSSDCPWRDEPRSICGRAFPTSRPGVRAQFASLPAERSDGAASKT
jgi:hypothetical protein